MRDKGISLIATVILWVPASSARIPDSHEFPVGILPEGFAPLQPFEEFFENAHYDGVDAAPSSSAHSRRIVLASAPTCSNWGEQKGRPALRVCWISTSLLSTWLKAKRTILARSPFTRASSVTASLNSSGSRRVIPADPRSTVDLHDSLFGLFSLRSTAIPCKHYALL